MISYEEIKMVRIHLTLFTFLCCIDLSGQTFSKSDFSNTDWFTENIDSLFFKADTVRLIQHINYGPVWDKDAVLAP
jgi:hypothetical protein